MNRWVRRICGVGCALCLAIQGMGTAQAASKTENTADSAAEAVSQSADTTDGQTVSVEKNSDGSYTETIPITADWLFDGVYGDNSMSFRVPDYWESCSGEAHISYRVSELIDSDVPAALTFSLNDTPLSSLPLAFQSETQTASVSLGELESGYYTFDSTGYAELYDEDGCIDETTNANWTTILAGSCLSLTFTPRDSDGVISEFPYPFLSAMDLHGENLGVYAMDTEALSAGLLVRGYLGSLCTDDDEVSFRQGEGDRNDRIVIGLTRDMPEAYISEDAGDKAVIRVAVNSKKEHVLAVYADTEELLTAAANDLLDSDRTKNQNTDSVTVKAEQTASTASDNTVSIGDLSGGGVKFTGPFHQSKQITLEHGTVPAAGSSVDLQFRYSDNLDFDRSLVTVYWGDIPVASKKLEQDRALGDELSFEMPADAVGTYAGSITIVFDLELQDLFCTPRADQMPWAYVSADSSLTLKDGETGRPDFSYLPWPFVSGGTISGTTVVVPNEMTAAEAEALGRVFTIACRGASGSLKVASPDDNVTGNIIAIGTSSDNAYLSGLSGQLSIAWKDGTFAANDQFTGGGDGLGVLQFASTDGGTVLAVCGTSDDSFTSIRSGLAKETDTWNLKKDAAVIDADGNIASYRFLSAQTESKVTLASFVSENRDTVLFAAAAAGIMVLILLGIILILVRNKKNKRDE